MLLPQASTLPSALSATVTKVLAATATTPLCAAGGTVVWPSPPRPQASTPPLVRPVAASGVCRGARADARAGKAASSATSASSANAAHLRGGDNLRERGGQCDIESLLSVSEPARHPKLSGHQ